MPPLRIIFVVPPFSGHLHPVIPLAKAARENGYAVSFVTGVGKQELLHALGFETHMVCSDDPYAMERIGNTPTAVTNNPWLLLKQLRENIRILPGIRRELEHIFQRAKPDIVVADFTAPIAGTVADAMGIPWITTMPSPCVLETKKGTPSYFRGLCHARHGLHRIRDASARRATRWTKQFFGKIMGRRMRSLGLSIYRDDGTEASYSRTAILGFGLMELEFERDWPASFRMIGPVTESPEPHAPRLNFSEWKERKKVLITLGTHLFWAKNHLEEKLQPLFAAYPELAFIVSLGDFHSKSSEPVKRGTNWSVYPYVPYGTALAQFDAVIHHGGTGVVYSCIEHGVPALAWPHDYDQFDVAQRVEEKGIGFRIGSVRDAINRLPHVLDGFDRTALISMQRAFHRYAPSSAFLNLLAGIQKQSKKSIVSQ